LYFYMIVVWGSTLNVIKILEKYKFIYIL
jgi:hypothetical protein